MAESLRSGITPETIADEIIMQWKSPGFANKTLILVEGKDDRLFYYKFFNHDTSEVVDCKGCKKVIEVYKILQRRSLFLHVTIKDSDFERLNGPTISNDNFFLSDCHDYEMMCLKNPRTVKSLFENLAIPYDEKIIERVFSDLQYLSYFKWYNYTYHNNYKFKTFSVTDKSAEELRQFNHIHACILPVSPNCNQIEESTLDKFIDEKKVCDPYELTNGHDFIRRLCHHIKRKHREWSNLNEERLKNILHPCFNKEDFAETNLYHIIKAWETYTKNIILQS